MVYKVEFTEYGANTRDDATEYLLYKVGGTGNPQAAKKFMDELDDTLDRLEAMAESFAYCENPKLYVNKIRKLHFRHMAYKVFYRVEGNIVFIDAILSDRRDYENLLG